MKLDKIEMEKKKTSDAYLYQGWAELIYGTTDPWLWTDSGENILQDFLKC